MEHLIANTGIQFVTHEVEFNPDEQLVLPDGKSLKYTFLEYSDSLLGVRIFDLLCSCSGVYIPLNELREGNGFDLRPDGREKLDVAGLTVPRKDVDASAFTNLNPGSSGVYSITNLTSYNVPNPNDVHAKIPAFELLLDKWLPVPMYEKGDDGYTVNLPLAWCRLKIERIGKGSMPDVERFRLIWAFDTELSENPLSNLRPCFYEGDASSKNFGLCNCAYEMFEFLSKTKEKSSISAFSEYIYALLGSPKDNFPNKYIAYYIYFVNYLRIKGFSPEITLHNNSNLSDVQVDLVLDIGNSRTCGVLFENGEFTKGQMLKIRDLTHPNVVYDKAFDMRFVFRQADFGNEIILPEEVFKWYSFVRVGDEAKHLVYKSLEQCGMSSMETNYSSPKRYLWDQNPFEGHWENLVKVDDSFGVQQTRNIYVPKLSEMFESDGSYIPIGGNGVYDILADVKYSRSSLMMMVLIEIFQQAISQINSPEFRLHHGDIDRKRVLRNIILTCPTAMPRAEQIKLRKCAENAFDAISRCIPCIKKAMIIPASENLKPIDGVQTVWGYDEASCCQLTYLYAEIAQRYMGSISTFFDLKGHVRKEDIEVGVNEKTLTVGTIDIGAGTTDVMICSYKNKGNTSSRLAPTPLYWDSFYLAGDDILRNLIQNLIIEGNDLGVPNMGNIRSALINRIMKMSYSEIMDISSIKVNHVYQGLARNIKDAATSEEIEVAKRVLANNLMCDFFGNDSAGMSHKARRCRLDFNTQISVPIAQMFLELLRLKRPTKVYEFNDIFPSNKPAAYLLNYFEEHFGFRFEDLSWRFEPDKVIEIVKSTLEPLMKQLAVVLYSHNCDIIVLAGRPTSLEAITELFVKYVPTTPDRLVRLNEYRVGNFFPTATGEGYFYDQKSFVAVGAMVGFLATSQGLPGFALDMSTMIKKMESTARYIGEYDTAYQQVKNAVLTPTQMTATLDIPMFPIFIGCKQFDSPVYQARPLYALYSNERSLKVSLARNYQEDMEVLYIEEVHDEQGEQLPYDKVTLVPQSLVDDGKYWLDKGAFTLSIN